MSDAERFRQRPACIPVRCTLCFAECYNLRKLRNSLAVWAAR